MFADVNNCNITSFSGLRANSGRQLYPAFVSPFNCFSPQLFHHASITPCKYFVLRLYPFSRLFTSGPQIAKRMFGDLQRDQAEPPLLFSPQAKKRGHEGLVVPPWAGRTGLTLDVKFILLWATIS